MIVITSRLIDCGGIPIAQIPTAHWGKSTPRGMQTTHKGKMMRERLKTAAAPAAVLLAAIAFAAMTAPEASAGEFCRRDVTGHMTSCGFDNMEQCHAMAAGIGGDCFRDPFHSESSNALAYHPKLSRSRQGRHASRAAANAD
jgi:Protein of unknown function (DUF3551)